MFVIRMDEPAQIAGGAPGDEHPFVGNEPFPMKVPHETGEYEALRRDESPERRPLVPLAFREILDATRVMVGLSRLHTQFFHVVVPGCDCLIQAAEDRIGAMLTGHNRALVLFVFRDTSQRSISDRAAPPPHVAHKHH